MKGTTRDIILKTIGLICVAIAFGFIFQTVLEFIVDIKFQHEISGFLYEDGPPTFILLPFLFTTLMLYVIPKKPNLLIRIIRSLFLTITVTYMVGVTLLIAQIETMDDENVYSLCAAVAFFLLPGTIILELPSYYKQRDSEIPPEGPEGPFEKARIVERYDAHPPRRMPLSEDEKLAGYNQELQLYHARLEEYKDQLEKQERMVRSRNVPPDQREEMMREIEQFKQQTEMMEREYYQRKRELDRLSLERLNNG
jgi:hypothetical protein